MNNSAQTFWLNNLQRANRYNGWVFSQILPYLGHEVLEVGCGNGNFTELLAQQCSRLVAVDLNAEYAQLTATRLVSTGIKVVAGDASRLQWQQPFDTVVMLDVLEHIDDDVQMLRHLNESIKSGGKLILKVPALTSLYSPMDKAIGHYRRYTKKTLEEALTQAGFWEPLLWYFNVAGIPGWWFNGKVLGLTTPPSEQIDWFNQLVPLLSSIEAKVDPPIGLSLFAVAKVS